MALRSYTIKGGGNENTVPVRINGLTKYITFKKNGWDDSPAQFDTMDETLAMAIEQSPLYARGLIEVTGDTVPFGDQDYLKEGQAREYPDVTSVKDAKDILNKDFDVPFSKMPNAEETKKIAKEYGVRFPGLA